MTSDGRSLLEILKGELRFLEEGDYRYSPNSKVETATYLSDCPTRLNFDRSKDACVGFAAREDWAVAASVGDWRAKREQCDKLLKARRGEVAERLNAAVC